MSTHAADLVRQCFTAYETQDRALIEAALSDDFTFSSPVDDHIDRATYFERCWPISKNQPKFQLQPILIDGDQAIVRYQSTQPDGSSSRNTEIFTLAGGKVKHVDVYFGTDTADTVNDLEIKSLIENWAAAIARKDASATIAAFTDAPVNFFLAPPLVADESLQDNLNDWFATFQGPLRHEIHDLQITAGHPAAWARGLIHLTGTKTDATHTDLWYRLTLGLDKSSGSWKIAHAHESVPFLMDGTDKAATHLKPPEIGMPSL